MTDQEDTAEKNEQELNLFSAQQPQNAQDEPEFAGFEGRNAAVTGVGTDAGAAMDQWLTAD